MEQDIAELKILSHEERSDLVQEIVDLLRKKGKKRNTDLYDWLDESYGFEMDTCSMFFNYEKYSFDSITRLYIQEKFGRPSHFELLREKDVTGYTADYLVSKERGLESIGLETFTIALTEGNKIEGVGSTNSYHINPIPDKERESFDVLLHYIKDRLEAAPDPKER